MTPERCYLLCTTMRSGSTMLSSGLRDTGVAGAPTEYFAPLVRLPAAQVFALRPDEYRELLMAERSRTSVHEFVRDVMQRGTTPNGVFGAKIHYHHSFSDFQNAVEVLREHLNGEEAGNAHAVFSRAFPNLRYIWLRREDKVAQAVSLFRAVKTEEFVRLSEQGPAAASMRLRSEDFDYEAIQKHAIWVSRGDLAWSSFFKSNKIEPLVVKYEELVVSYEETIRQILRFIGIAPEGVRIERTRHERQADAISKEWRERFIGLQAFSRVAASPAEERPAGGGAP
jgi:LPS sulfotransferase NodH